jgi:hypothetical protein
MIDGAPTFAGGLSYGKAVAFMGAFGAIGGPGLLARLADNTS